MSAESFANQLTAHGLACERNDRMLFQNLNFTIKPGEVLQIHGANGTGKTTLLRILAGLTTANAGTVSWNGSIIVNSEEFKANITYIGHNPGIKLNLTVHENIALSLALASHSALSDIDYALKHMDLAKYNSVLAKYLSAGQLRRVALAKLLLLKTPIWILDEPFTALDTKGTAMVSSLMDEHLQQDGMIIMSSHQPIQLTQPRIQHLVL